MKTEQEIENTLKQGSTLSLSESEKMDMKKTLLAQVEGALPVSDKPIVSPWSTWFVRSSVAFASLVLVFGVSVRASLNSLPGEPLYALKIHAVEELVGLTKVTSVEKFEYSIEQMETRLAELSQLTASDVQLNQEDLQLIQDQIEDHVAETLVHISTFSTSSTDYHEEKIDMISELIGITRAQEKVISENEQFTPISEDISDLRRETGHSLEESVSSFIASSTSAEISGYLSERLDEVELQIDETTLQEQGEVLNKQLSDAEEALTEGDTDEAIVLVLEVKQTLDVEEYTKEQ